MRAASHPARPLQGRRGVSTPVRTPPAPARQRTLDASPRCRDCRNLRVAARRDRVFPQFTENTMPPPCNTGPDAAASQNPGDIDLESLLGDSDAHLVYEGLY